MKQYDINPILEQVRNILKTHQLGTGEYARYLNQQEANPYGCADAANILYTINEFPRDPAERQAWVDTLRSFQDPETGLFQEGSHHIYHTTAHCVAALELFDAMPAYPLTELKKFLDIRELKNMLEGIDWLHCGQGAHAGAGLYAALVITDTADEAWREDYFRLFNEACNPEKGMWVEEPVEKFPVWNQMGDAFHYLFNYEHHHEPFPYPDKLIDSCIWMYQNGLMPEKFGRWFHFVEMDWVYCLNRASRQTKHRFEEVQATLLDFAEKYLDYLYNVDWPNDPGANDVHLLFGVICCLAELQQALPGLIRSAKPLRLVLDRRPFI